MTSLLRLSQRFHSPTPHRILPCSFWGMCAVQPRKHFGVKLCEHVFSQDLGLVATVQSRQTGAHRRDERFLHQTCQNPAGAWGSPEPKPTAEALAFSTELDWSQSEHAGAQIRPLRLPRDLTGAHRSLKLEPKFGHRGFPVNERTILAVLGLREAPEPS